MFWDEEGLSVGNGPDRGFKANCFSGSNSIMDFFFFILGGG